MLEQPERWVAVATNFLSLKTYRLAHRKIKVLKIVIEKTESLEGCNSMMPQLPAQFCNPKGAQFHPYSKNTAYLIH
jgi:hypothetical protein